ncbi:MAG TPA: efflux transporter outer membrane subunit [Stellaceae bacterium]|nr:efflux transporter outer membrane subunit [Stellaceae bacterium]
MLRRPSRAVLSLSALLAGCTVGPDFAPPPATPDAGYRPGGAADLATPPGVPAQHLAFGDEAAGDWWTMFRSPALNAVLQDAVAQNRDLAAARSSLDAAHEVVNEARGGLFPQIDLAGTAERQKLNFAAFGLKQPPETFNIFSIGPTVSYSLDPFGKNRRLVEERAAQAEVQNYQTAAIYLSLTGNTVSDALLVASLRAQIKTTEDIIRDDENTLDLARKAVQGGAATQMDVETARSQLATDRTLLPPLRQQLSVARHALSVLVGKSPAEWSPPDFTLDSLTLPARVPVSLPSELVHRRPDILASEAELHAASAAIGVATAQLYPNITLTGGIEQIATGTGALLTAGNNAWNIAGGLTLPLFHGGALEAQKRGAEDNFNAALASYQQTVLVSFAQVADTLDALQHDTEYLNETRQSVEAAGRSLELTRRAYQAGDLALLPVLDASRVSQRARIAYIRAQAQRYLDTAQLFLAMGGGWWERPELRQAGTEPSLVPAH